MGTVTEVGEPSSVNAGVYGATYVAWIDTDMRDTYGATQGCQHACCIAMSTTYDGVVERVLRWRRRDRWTCAGRTGASAATVEVSISPPDLAAEVWGRELAYRAAMHGAWAIEPVDRATHDMRHILAVQWGASLGLGPQCGQRLWFPGDPLCGVVE